MSVFEVIGIGIVIYMAATGMCAHVMMVTRGVGAIRKALDVGHMHSDVAVREYLERMIR
jgi:hypothetical protein